MNQNVKHVMFNHLVLEGSAYDVSRMQGEIIQHIPKARNFFTLGKGKFEIVSI